jgi:Zn-dependent metalloprotease
LVVDETGAITQASELSSGAVDDTGCPLDPPWPAFPAVTVDPMTQTPTFVGLRALGGIATSGATNLERAYDALSRNPLRQMFGSLEPAHHLTLIRELTNARGEAQISLQQVHAGVPVEGAALAVTLGPTGRALEVAGRFVFRPTSARSPRVSQATALKQALPEMLRECGGDRCPQAQQDPPSVSLVVLSSEIFPGTALPPKTARLAWRILYAGRQMYWDAEAGQGSLFTFSADREFLYTIANLGANSAVEIVDGMPVSGVTPSTEAINTAAILDPDRTNPIESFYSSRGWRSFDNAGGRLFLSVNGSRISRAAWRPADPSTGTPPRMFLNTGWAVPDVVAHEFTHGITEFSAGLANVGEPGGLGESYSDVLASAIFPDTPAPTTWQMGEASPLGTLRDLRSPELRCSNPNIPDCVAHPRHYAQVPDNCGSAQDGEACSVHALSAIPSLAAVFMADGGNPGSTAPIGRAKLAELTFRALTGGRLFAGARFLQHTSVMVTTCHDLAAVQAAGFTFADCDHVERALFDVGLSNNFTYGWLRFGNSPTGFKSNEDRFSGQHLFRGCTIASHELVATDSNGTSQRVTGSTAAALALDMGDWGTYVDHRGADTDATDRHVNLRVWSRWYLSAQVDIAENLDVPPGVARREDCYVPAPQNPQSPPAHLRILYSTTRIAHWATFLNGGRFDEYVNATLSPLGGGPGYIAVPIYMPAGCEIIDIAAIDYHSGVPYGSPSPGAVHGGHNFSVSRVYTHPASLAAFVHTWHDGASAVRVRVVYTIAEPDGTDCSVPGATQDTP